MAASVAGVLSVHHVRTRGRRDAIYVDLTVRLDGDTSLRDAHAVADRIEEALAKAHPGIADVVVHLEPEQPLADSGKPGGAGPRTQEFRTDASARGKPLK